MSASAFEFRDRLKDHASEIFEMFNNQVVQNHWISDRINWQDRQRKDRVGRTCIDHFCRVKYTHQNEGNPAN